MSGFDFDSFSSGQMGSKLWLSEKLEENLPLLGVNKINRLVVFGSWYGVSGLLLLIRSRVQISQVINIDIDNKSLDISRRLYDFWVFRSWLAEDLSDPQVSWVNAEDRSDYVNDLMRGQQWDDVFLNTSSEHMSPEVWWPKLPSGANVAIQSCNMKHKDHSFPCESLDQLVAQFPLTHTAFAGELRFDYPDGNDFKRFMVVGKK